MFVLNRAGYAKASTSVNDAKKMSARLLRARALDRMSGRTEHLSIVKYVEVHKEEEIFLDGAYAAVTFASNSNASLPCGVGIEAAARPTRAKAW